MGELEVEKTAAKRLKEKLVSFSTECRSSHESAKAPLLAVEDRAMDKEDLGGLAESVVKKEASRCFNCGCLAVNPSDVANMLYAYDFAVLAVAGTCLAEDGVVKNISMVLGAAAPIPVKLREAEQYLIGKKLTEETAAEAAEIALKDAIPLEMNAYKIEMAKVMIRRFLGF